MGWGWSLPHESTPKMLLLGLPSSRHCSFLHGQKMDAGKVFGQQSAPRGARMQLGDGEKGLQTGGPCCQLSVLLSLQLTSEDMIAAFSQAMDW